jgi:hypothetical protein
MCVRITASFAHRIHRHRVIAIARRYSYKAYSATRRSKFEQLTDSSSAGIDIRPHSLARAMDVDAAHPSVDAPREDVAHIVRIRARFRRRMSIVVDSRRDDDDDDRDREGEISRSSRVVPATDAYCRSRHSSRDAYRT